MLVCHPDSQVNVRVYNLHIHFSTFVSSSPLRTPLVEDDLKKMTNFDRASLPRKDLQNGEDVLIVLFV